MCVRHYKMLTKAGPPRQKHARAVRQRSGRFVAWEKVNLPKLTAAPGVDTLQIEGAPASAPAGMGCKAHGARKAKRAKRKTQASSSGEEQDLEGEGIGEYERPPDPGGEAPASAEAAQTLSAPLSAPAEIARKTCGASKAKCAKRIARASSSEEEQDLEWMGIEECRQYFDPMGDAVDSRHHKHVGAGKRDCSQKEPALGTSRPICRREDADDSHAESAAGAGDIASARDTSPGRRRRASIPSQGNCIRRPGAGGYAEGIAEDTGPQNQGPQHSEGNMPVVMTRRSSRKRRVG